MGSIRLEVGDDKIIVEYNAKKYSEEEIKNIMETLASGKVEAEEEIMAIGEKIIDVIIDECRRDVDQVIDKLNLDSVSVTKEESGETTKYIITYDPENEESIILAEIISTGIARLPFQRFESTYSEYEELEEEGSEEEE